MKFLPASAEVLAALGAAVPLWYFQAPKPAPAALVSPAPTTASAVGLDGTRYLARLPVAFVPNLGQWGHAARYVARLGATTIFFSKACLSRLEFSPPVLADSAASIANS